MSTHHPLLRKLLTGAVIGGAIKVAGIGFAFLFFLVLARVMTPEQYGIFAAGFSLATILGFVATVGQHTAILRFWPSLDEAYGSDVAAHAILRGLKLTIMGAGMVVVGSTLIGFTQPHIAAFGADPWIYPAIGIMAAAFALAEYMAGALRAKGSLMLALGPRDVAWRIAVMLVALAIGTLSGVGAIAIAAVMLLIVMVPQGFALIKDLRSSLTAGGSLPSNELFSMQHAQWGLWGNAIAFPVINQATTIFIGLFISPSAAGSYFAADRLSKLLSVALIATNQVSGPIMSRHWRIRNIKEVLIILIASTGFATAIALIVFFIYFYFGQSVLSLFNPDFATAYSVLIILSLGQFINVICGPNTLFLNMTGNENILLRTMIAWGFLGVLLTIITAIYFDIFATAIASTISIAGWNIHASAIAKKEIKSQLKNQPINN